MVGTFRPRRLASVALLGALVFGLAACARDYPNSTFNPNTEYNGAIKSLWDKLLFLGTAVFVLVEAGLIYTIIRFKRRPGGGTPNQVHGHTLLEITWTAIPAVILVFVAIPTVRTIFKTQAKAAPDALQVEVIGHQWWWEFRYPQYGIVTANELYLPNGRTVNFTLHTQDVLHSFWIPQLGGKRDLISNKTNYVWFTPNQNLPSSAWNGFCAEFCGASHANMKFRVYNVTADDFGKWTAHQKDVAAFPAGATAPAAPAGTAPTVPAVPSGAGSVPVIAASMASPIASPQQAVQKTQPQAKPGLSNQAPQTSPLPAASTAAQAAAAPVFAFPRERLAKEFPHTIPTSREVSAVTYDEAALAKGDPARGMQVFVRGSCIGCHAIAGNPMAMGNIGPNLTHVATRWTLAGAMYPNTPLIMAKWIKNAPAMKPGSLMPALGKGQYDPRMKAISPIGLTDADIADVVAYLQALK
jgi:cytochrome c oxidase subunit 2